MAYLYSGSRVEEKPWDLVPSQGTLSTLTWSCLPAWLQGTALGSAQQHQLLQKPCTWHTAGSHQAPTARRAGDGGQA